MVKMQTEDKWLKYLKNFKSEECNANASILIFLSFFVNICKFSFLEDFTFY